MQHSCTGKTHLMDLQTIRAKLQPCGMVMSHFPVRNRLWLNRHPFADIIVYRKGSCWLSYTARDHAAEWQKVAI